MKYFILLFTLLFHTLVYSQLNTSNRTVNQKLNFKAGANFDSLTASTVLTLDGSKNLTSSSITTTDLAFIDNLLGLDTNGDGIVQFVDSTDSFTASKVISGTEGIVLPSGTTAERDGTPTAGEIRYNTDTNTFEGYSNAWGAIGGGGGGGLDIFYNQDHETDVDSSDYTTGLNATFDNGGTLGGALANETTNPIAGATSIKYTTSATATNSTNDWIASASITLDDKQKGNFVGFNFFYTWDGSDDLLCVVVWDDTNDAVLNDSTDCLETASNPTRYSLGVFIPTSTNAIKLGFHHTGASESSKVLVFDDIELSSNPFVYKNLTDTHSFRFSAAASTMTVSTSGTALRWGTLTEYGDDRLLSYNDSTGAFTVLRNCVVNILAIATLSGSSNMFIYLNGSTGYNGSGAVALGHISGALNLVAGDYFSIGSNANLDTASQARLEVIATASAEHVVTPAKAVNEFYKTTTIDVSNFWDATGATDNIDVSLIPLTNSQLLEWNDTTETRLVAKKDVVVDVSVYGVTAVGNNISIRDSSGNAISYVRESASGYLSEANLEIKLDAGDYIYFLHGSAGSRTGGITISARAANAEFLAAVPKPTFKNEEQFIGYWFGEKLYERSFDRTGAANSNTTTAVATIDANLIPISLNGMALTSSGNWETMESGLHGSSSCSYTTFHYDESNGNINYRPCGDNTSRQRFTIRYTR